MKFVKWFVLFLIAAGIFLYHNAKEKAAQRQAEMEYKREVAALENFKVEIPELHPREEIDLPDNVLVRLHKSLKSNNVAEAGKAIEYLWKIHDDAVLPVMKKYLADRNTYCFEDGCGTFKADMKNRIMDIITRDISQLNFDFLKISIKDRDKNIRIRTVNKISEYFTEEALEVLNPALNDSSPEVRTATMDGIMRIKEGIKNAKQAKLDEINNRYRNRKTLKDNISPEAILKVLD